MALDDRLRDDAHELAPDLVRLRRLLHRQPEVGLDLPLTQRTVVQELEGLDIEISLGEALSSVTGVIRGGGGDGAVLLRADMDALPVSEATGLDFSSAIDGAMHAYGHDLPTAMLVGVS
jgi:hippurate hydrolase